MQTTISFAGTNTTGAVIDLYGSTAVLPGSAPRNKCGAVTISVNGASGGDFWVCPIGIQDGSAIPANISMDPRPAAGNSTYLRQLKSGESYTWGTPNSKGYDPAVHGALPATLPTTTSQAQTGWFSHVIVWCQAAGTVSAVQLQIQADPGK